MIYLHPRALRYRKYCNVSFFEYHVVVQIQCEVYLSMRSIFDITLCLLLIKTLLSEINTVDKYSIFFVIPIKTVKEVVDFFRS